jgi:hypothetical protein
VLFTGPKQLLRSFSSPSNRLLLISDQQRAMRLDGKNGWQFAGQKHWSGVVQIERPICATSKEWVLACPSPSASYQVLGRWSPN